MNTRLTLSLLLAVGLGLSACAKKAPEVLPPDPGGTPAATESAGGDTGAPTPGSQADFVAQMMGQDTIYFDTDRYNIDATDQQALAMQAQWLMKYPAKRITIEGHADERGTREYNLALGQRRSEAVRQMALLLGARDAQIEAISFGKERPRSTGSSEADYADNRRADFVYRR